MDVQLLQIPENLKFPRTRLIQPATAISTPQHSLESVDIESDSEKGEEDIERTILGKVEFSEKETKERD